MEEQLTLERITPPERIHALMKRMYALMRGERIDRVPFFPHFLGFTARNVGYPIASFYTDAEKCFWAQVCTLEQYGCDGFPFFGWPEFGIWEFGGQFTLPTGEYDQGPMTTHFPVESEADVEKLKLPDVKTAGSIPIMMEFARLEERFGLPITFQCGSPLFRVASICNRNQLIRWVIKKPELVHRLCRLTTDFLLDLARYWVDTFGPERLVARSGIIFEANTILSPKQFEEFGLPYMKELHEKVLAMGVKHFYTHVCGEHNLNLPHLAQVPMGDPGLVSIPHQVDLTTAIKYFGDTSIIMGNVEPQVIQNGTPEQVYELCKQAIEKGKYAPRGYVLMTGCELPVMAPPYNVYMMKKAAEDFGWYE